MKILIAVLAFAAYVCVNGLSEDLAKKIEQAKVKVDQIIATCVEETGVGEDVPKKLKSGDFSVRGEKAKCFVNCFFEKSGFVNSAGEPQKDAMIEKFSITTSLKFGSLEELITKCIKKTGANKCERSFNIYKCYKTNKAAAFLTPA